VHNDGKLALKIEHIAFADRACNNLHHQWSPFSKKRRGHLSGGLAAGNLQGIRRVSYLLTLLPPSYVSQSAATSHSKA
jgi:hypothetical protein